ncbi:expressed unknown protein [Seminavis robusta]|uniref:Uncharacterized protein n=1 Tax=Seminavis robusta TaxID=568900 RepID=A0A9N8E890_9STRA|nr:expressed unknown protein [Seminavis robusta]|eukprot:Sro792_g203060.1 n/a (103) ;mRNA; f:13225-13608
MVMEFFSDIAVHWSFSRTSRSTGVFLGHIGGPLEFFSDIAVHMKKEEGGGDETSKQGPQYFVLASQPMQSRLPSDKFETLPCQGEFCICFSAMDVDKFETLP